MKKIIFVAILALGFAFTASAQTPVFQKGSKVGNVGIGFGSYGLPIEVAYSQGLKNNIFDVKGLNFGVGGYLGFRTYSKDYELYNYPDVGYRYTEFIIGPRAHLNYTFVKNLEVYSGIMLGWNISSSSSYGNWGNYHYEPESHGGFYFSWFAGARYYFNPKWAIYVETGYGIAYGTIGVSHKF
ncbi:MAG: hypothetical protein EOM29_03915 [Bacteroidia bacterium]|nr:hypothetical protein [Bacteroidia bacterium]